MKIFKNRGDFYISKANYKSSREERVLISLLIFVIIITIVFFVLLGQKYDSVKDFFGEGEITTVEIAKDNENKLPAISGKRNFLIIETDDEESTIHYLFLLQADRDSKAYKVCTLSPKMNIDGIKISDIYSQGGGASLQTKLTSYLGINIDYYAALKKEDLTEFLNKCGKITYSSKDEIKFSNEEKDDSFALRISKGNSNIDGADFSGLMRYFSNEKVSYAKANEAVLYGVTQLLNPENFEDIDALFKLFINNSSTNITVRDFQDNKDAIYVFSEKNTKLDVYSVNSEYDSNNVLSQKTVGNIKGYFSE